MDHPEAKKKCQMVLDTIKQEGVWGTSRQKLYKSFQFTDGVGAVEQVIDKILRLLVENGAITVNKKQLGGVEFDWFQYVKEIEIESQMV